MTTIYFIKVSGSRATEDEVLQFRTYHQRARALREIKEELAILFIDDAVIELYEEEVDSDG